MKLVRLNERVGLLIGVPLLAMDIGCCLNRHRAAVALPYRLLDPACRSSHSVFRASLASLFETTHERGNARRARGLPRIPPFASLGT